MALIKCPECGNTISDKANICIHCGFPMDGNKTCSGNTFNVVLLETGNVKPKIAKFIKDYSGYSPSEVFPMVSNLPYLIYKNISFDEAEKIKNSIIALGGKANIEEYNKERDTDRTHVFTEELRCPSCGSTQVSIGKRGATLTFGLIGSNKTVNRCGKCGYSWKP